MAQMRYTEPAATLDADVPVAVSQPDRLDALGGVRAFCAARGHLPEGKAVRVGSWPVQFVPAFSPLTREAMELAETADFDGVPLRVVGAGQGLCSRPGAAGVGERHPRRARAAHHPARPRYGLGAIRVEVPPSVTSSSCWRARPAGSGLARR